jgi:hypothetical protein
MSETLTRAALPIVIEVYSTFRGLVDGETEVDGSELITFMRSLLDEYPEVKVYLRGYLVGKAMMERWS